ncbi:hypothetical protein ARTSIC4J27_512 [Pseudarthrobacter siccitolerans]|uniref:Uncharacterized protein n=1 Tax=Pseudarthrobacter siccitolerans TaxID=861266 RepID=A0A024GXB7_9MICC|nr:hypothetical protein ARTSIC4J27_512 [Pseudarthrobacter siccitolerans]
MPVHRVNSLDTRPRSRDNEKPGDDDGDASASHINHRCGAWRSVARFVLLMAP